MKTHLSGAMWATACAVDAADEVRVPKHAPVALAPTHTDTHTHTHTHTHMQAHTTTCMHTPARPPARTHIHQHT
jgi:hypothetical protein